ncbi:Na+/H+ antiporter NhaC [Alkaliphilus metalliredigens QYMF]|uniref:Na+/H+ antiporter NhaC n=1 Tax=Alkaliphilus metalliredigens (strain QYMF) TaxID=293826 RepID=A6TWX0_ALKMQ|nr:Na+/H+ antiporter NhaC [Alkaliphilus metalliredigens]ABR50688.1 Na+/H+ antiporter NhaC [Alkaliphilus metalliredigens QYMF]
MKTKKEATLLHALIPILFLIVALSTSIIVFGADPHIPLIATIIVASLVATISLGYTWGEIEAGMIDTIKMGMQAALILMVIGTIIGTWILSGTVPTMIYYGLQILSPGIFLVATALICAIVSLATGSSWTTAGTVGIALLGIGQGLGMPPGLIAGAIISGAYFGDKMSPLSDTTNLAPAMAGAELFEHIKHMVYTTVPALIISLVLYGIIGMRYAGNVLDMGNINAMLDAMTANFTISPLLLIPPIVVILIVVMKVPALPGLIAGTILGGIFAAIFQGASFGAIIDAAHYGFELESGLEIVDDLLSGGGLDSMMWTVSLILIALSFGGVMERTGMLHAIGKSILSLANSTGSLILATVLTCIAVNLLAAEQYIAIVVPGRMYKDTYTEKGIHPKVLSRTLEDAGTLTSVLIPWNTCGAFMFATLGVHAFQYAPYAFLNILTPLIAVIYGFIGFTITPLEKDDKIEGAKV